jgi:hypothetical protein
LKDALRRLPGMPRIEKSGTMEPPAAGARTR